MIFNRWRINKVKKRLLSLDYVYDVMYEKSAENRYLVHIWVVNLTERVRGILDPQIRDIMKRRPRHIKVDVLLYRREVG